MLNPADAYTELSAALIELRLTIDENMEAKENLRQAKLAYEAIEAQVMDSAHANAMGKNAEARKAEIEAVLWGEREQDGELGQIWKTLQVCITKANKADAELEKARNRFTYAQIAAKLVSLDA